MATVTNLGVILDDNGNAIGTYDNVTGICENLQGDPIECPKLPNNVIQPTVSSDRTYFMLAIGVLGLLLIIFMVLYFTK